jgi:metal-dependent amidase/aminoacylase/carboxypeptidase family protein
VLNVVDVSESLDDHMDGIIKLSKDIYNFSEPGSMEFRSSEEIIWKMKENV